MNIKLILTISFSILYGFFEIFMSRRHQSKRSVSRSGDKGSIWIIVLSISAGYWLSFMAASTRTGRIYHWDAFFAIGAILAVIGLVIRISALKTLKQQFTYTVTEIENHELVETGLYKYIRHPGYLGQLIIFLAIATSLSNWLSMLLMIIPVSAGFLYRINVEEKFLVEQMGRKYIDYKERTRKLIPYLF